MCEIVVWCLQICATQEQHKAHVSRMCKRNLIRDSIDSVLLFLCGTDLHTAISQMDHRPIKASPVSHVWCKIRPDGEMGEKHFDPSCPWPGTWNLEFSLSRQSMSTMPFRQESLQTEASFQRICPSCGMFWFRKAGKICSLWRAWDPTQRWNGWGHCPDRHMGPVLNLNLHLMFGFAVDDVPDIKV